MTNLGSLTVAGQIQSTERNSVHGWIQLADRRHPLLLHLTGNVASNLMGKQVDFRSPDHLGWSRECLATQPRMPTEWTLASHQVGPLYRFAVEFDDLPGDAPVFDVADARLDLEWSGQEGRVRVNLPLCRVQIVDPSRTQAADNLAASERDLPDFATISADLKSVWDRQAFETDVRIHVDDALERHFALIDDMMQGEKDVPMHTIFDPPLKLLPPRQLDDAAVDRALLDLLARLARYGIALDMCEHFTPRQAYELMIDVVLHCQVYPRISETGYMQHYTTFEHCSRCAEEFVE